MSRTAVTTATAFPVCSTGCVTISGSAFAGQGEPNGRFRASLVSAERLLWALSGHWQIAETDIATVADRKQGDAGKREIEEVGQRA
jgi:hypothetical protein